MIKKVQAYIEAYNMIQKKDKIVVGISGGADSVCLLFVLLELQKQYELELIGVHINHHIRGEEALRDQHFVEQLCRRYEIPLEVIDCDVIEEASRRNRSVEETGRDIRREAFIDVLHQYQGDKIALAHHANDNVETFLMNVARGTGLQGLKGIAPVRESWIRPLLCLERSEVEGYLQEREEAYCVDSTNLEDTYTRNMIRNQIVPIFENHINDRAVDHMSRVIEELSRIESYMSNQVSGAWRLCTVEKESNQVIIHKERLLEYPLIIQERVVKRAIEQVAGHQRDITRRHIEEVHGLLERQVGRKLSLPYKLLAKRVYDGIEIVKSVETVEVDKDKQEITLRIPGITMLPNGQQIEITLNNREKYSTIQETLYTKLFDYDIIKGDLEIRQREIGDYLIINTEGNKQTLKKYFVNEKIEAEQRDRIWNLAVDNQVLWVIGYRRSEAYKVTKDTKHILEIQIR